MMDGICNEHTNTVMFDREPPLDSELVEPGRRDGVLQDLHYSLLL